MLVTAVYDEGEAVPSNTLHIDAKPTAPEYDLAVKAVSVAPQLVAGVETTCRVTIANEGLNDVSAAEYQVTLSGIDETYVSAAVVSTDVSAGSEVSLTFVLKADFAAAQQQLSGTLTATVDFDKDLVADNNSATSDTFTAAFAAHDPVSAPAVDIDFEAHCPMLSWGSAASTDDSPLLGYNVYDAASGKVNTELLSDTSLSLSIDDNGHEFFVTAMYADGETAPSETAKIELEEKAVALSSIEGAALIYSGTTAQYVVTLSNSGISAATAGTDFALTTYAGDASEERELSIEPLSMAEVTIDVAINAMDVLFSDDIAVGVILDELNGNNPVGLSKDVLIQFVDKAGATDLSATEDYAAHVATLSWTAAADDAVLGYNVYDKATGLITDTPLSADATAFEVATSDSDRSYFVTAVYVEGEAEPSNNATVATVADLHAGEGAIVVCDDGVIVKGYAGKAVQVYDVAGRKVASTICDSDATHISLAKGTYLVQVADTVSKVAL
ncbi:MAG: T9SS type A sorting domain-containing protein [Muribaculaceae bacterium]